MVAIAALLAQSALEAEDLRCFFQAQVLFWMLRAMWIAVASAAPAKRSWASERLPTALITQPACSCCSAIQASSARRRSAPGCSRSGTTFMGSPPPPAP
jgi:hypothetical protein